MKNKIIFKTLMLKGEAGSTIVSMEKTGHVGTADIYTITFNDGSTTEISLENMSAITSVEKTSSTDTEDIYTITCADGSTQTFSVLNHNADIAALSASVSADLSDMADEIDTIDARVDNLVTDVNGAEVTTLWTGSLGTLNTPVTLSKSVSEFDFIDIYTLNGADTTFTRVPANVGTANIHVGNLSDDASVDFLQYGEMGISLSGTSATLTKAVAFQWSPPSAPEVTDDTTIAVVTRIDGVKTSASVNAELADLRVGADGVTYESAGAAVRGQISNLKEDFSTGTDIYVSTTETLGYIGGNGAINSPVATNREVYTDYIPVDINTVLNFHMYSTGNAYPMWSKLALYDSDKTFIRRVDLYYVSGTSIKSNDTVWTNTDPTVCYVRYTYRTGTTADGQWVYTTITHKRIDELKKSAPISFSKITKNKYIDTNVTAGSAVTLTPIAFGRYGCVVIPCSENDVFTISGRGGNAGRLWAFINSSNELISKAKANDYLLNRSITAPTNTAKLVLNFNMEFDYAVCKNDNSVLTSDVQTAIITQPIVNDLPKDLVSMPTVVFNEYVQQTEGVSGAKPTIFKNGDYFVITYGENLDGTGTDIPKVTESGVLAMKYKKFKYVDGVESEVSYGTFAEKGDTYTDYQGNTVTSVGGWGLPSGVNGLQYMTTAYTGTHTYNGVANYGMTPCCCSVNIDNSGNVTFGDIEELTLDIGGTVGKFDVTRLDPYNTSYLLYMTTASPYYSPDGYKWMIPVIGGLAYFTSSDGVNWIYEWTLETPYQPQCEVMCVACPDGDILFGARTQTRTSTTCDELYIGKVSQLGTLASQYKLPFSASRAFLIRNDSDVLLFYTAGSKNATECVRIIIENYSNLFFWKWFTIWKKTSWYFSCYNSVFAENFTTMYVCGGNGEEGSTVGMTFAVLDFDTSKPRRPHEIGFEVT